jgi:hypothetical protein
VKKDKSKREQFTEQVPDGWLIVHDTYLFGPFPSEEAAQAICDATLCRCKRRVEPVFFPPGVMLVIDMETLIEALKSRQVASDRKN